MPPADEITMVIVTRADLKLSTGKLAAQCGHAVMECTLKAKKETPRSLERYRREGARKIVLAVKDQREIEMLHNQIKGYGLICHLVRDAGHTEVPSGTVTVLGIGPAPRKEIDKFTSDLQLL